MWWSLWALCDIKLWPDKRFLSYGICIVIGACSGFVGLVLQRPLQAFFSLQSDEFNHSWKFAICDSTYKACLALASFFLWRGCWGLMRDNVLIGKNTVLLSVLWHFLGFSVLSFLQASSTLAAPHFSVDGDGCPTTAMACQIGYFQKWYACRVHKTYSRMNSEEVSGQH
jgi:hypothetical protein